MFKSLAHFVDKLEEENELVRIKTFVDPVLQIAEITDRMSKQPDGGKALLFENTGTPFPVITNMLGSERRICLALGVDYLDEFGELMRLIINNFSIPKTSFWEKVTMLPELSKIMSWMPVTVGGTAVCQQVVNHTPDLNQLPILKCWPGDGGRFITLPMVHTIDLETGTRNVGMYRMQVFAPNKTGMHWHLHKTGARHFQQFRNKNQKMPVAVTLGGDPAYTYAATAPAPDGLDEYMLAGFIRGKKVELTRCITIDMQVPVDVDFVIEGYIDPNEEMPLEGPFGDHTGFYSLPDHYPTLHVTCITHRKNAIYPATVVGVPPMEDAHIAKATERIFLQPLRITTLPELRDMRLPTPGVAHNLTLLSLELPFKSASLKAMNALWGAGQMMFNKILIAFNHEVDLDDHKQLILNAIQRVDPVKHFIFGQGVADVLDHATNLLGTGSKLFIDACGEPQFSLQTINSAEIEKTIRNNLPSIKSLNINLLEDSIPIVFMAIDGSQIADIDLKLKRLCNMPQLAPLLALVAVDAGVPIGNLNTALWYTLANIDPKRDIQICAQTGQARARIAVNAMRKNQFNCQPKIVAMDQNTIKQVDALWPKLNIGPLIASPSNKFKNFTNIGSSIVQFDS